MNIINNILEIKTIHEKNAEEPVGEFNNPITDEQIFQIEKLIEEQLPPELRQLYLFANGQSNNGQGLLFGEQFISSDEIVKQLEFSKTLIKPETKKIDNPEQSRNLIKKIVDFYISKAPKHELMGFRKTWYKMEFNCGVGSYGGPYLYADKNTTSKERGSIKIGYNDLKSISDTIKQLHELEKKSYNWDELNFVVYSTGKYEVERSFYNFDSNIPFTSTPENAIRKKYFHYKWVPIFSDHAGNYLGMDLDPDTNGKKGQIINFGRDEEKMFVLGDNLNSFFDFILNEVKKTDNKLLNSNNHLHDTLRELKK